MTRLRWLAVLVLGCFLLVGAAGCLLTQVDPKTGKNKLQTTGETIQEAAPLVPGPWGIIAGAAGTILAGVGSVLGSKAKAAAIEDVGHTSAVNPWLKIASDRRWLFPTIGAAVSIGRAAGLWKISLDELLPILAMLGIPAAGEFLKDARTPPPAPVT